MLHFALDIAGASDCPWSTEKNISPVGSGAMILYYDFSLISNRRLVDFCANVAEECNIPYTLSVGGGGRDTGNIQFTGNGVPLRSYRMSNKIWPLTF